tara:strand:+ start:83 stop:499 length:417 start_codon:yes stop_codon:yes gene_type:complete
MKMTTIKNHDVQSVNIQATTDKVFDYIANPTNLPKWTGAFKNVDEKSALLVTPNGELKIGLETKANKELGTIDWHMTMPDGSVGIAYSRVVANADGSTIYSFILLAPPAPIEEVEGALFQQMDILKKELQNLQTILGK